MRKKNLIRTFNRALYAGGTVFFIAGLLLLAVSSPALAVQSRMPASAPNPAPADVLSSAGSDVFNGVKANARVVYQESIADASQRLIDNLFQGEQPAACPCAGGNEDIQNSLLLGTPCPCWTVTPPPADTPGTPSSLVVASGCNCTCETASTTVCNVGGSDMIVPATWQLYANAGGAPSTGQVVASGQVGPLDSGECATLNVDPPFAGNYSYRFVQEPGAQGEQVIWSGNCTVGTECFPGTATPTATSTSTSVTVTATAPGVEITNTATVTPTATSTTGGTATPTRTSRPPLPVNLSAVCSYVGEDTMLWKVANSTNQDIDFTWQVVGSSESGSGTVDANGSTYFETSAGTKTVQLYVGGELADTEASQPPCKQALTVSYVCTANGLVWSITNPNSFGADYDWSIDGGAQTGSGMIPAGQTIAVATTTEGAHTFTLTWTDDRPGEHVTSVSSPADSCPAVTPTSTVTSTPTITATAPGVEITLTFTPTPTATNTQPVSTATFTPTATNTQPVSTATFTPTSTNTQPVSTATFTPTPTNTQPVGTATFTPTITATSPGVQITLTNTPTNTPTVTNTIPANTATFTPTVTNTVPANTATFTPTVTNTVPANTATFTPTVTNTVPASTATFTPTVTNTPTITSTAPGLQITLTFTPTATRTNTAPASQNLSLNSICSYPSDTTLLWSVTNPTSAAVAFTWRVVGSTETGTGTVSANSTAFFNTSAGSKVVELLVNGQVVASVSSAPPCRLPITVNYVCASPTTVNWYVTNGNNQTVPYVWTVDTINSGQSQIGPNTTQVFATTGLGQHTVTVTWLIEPLGPRGVQLTANVTTCGGVVTTPTQLVTLPPPVITSTPVIIPQTGGDFAAPALLTSMIGRLFTTIGLLLFGAAITISVITGRWKV